MKHADREPRPWVHPNRPLAIEAAVFAECARGKRNQHKLMALVAKELPRIQLVEIHEATQRLLKANRIVEAHEDGRAYPFYTIPPP